ncbi:MAG: flippase-like domain-containing protein [Chloroflexi bacterium]|nr:flippase-like domain-containing protein [Chloroflexota bacterium]
MKQNFVTVLKILVTVGLLAFILTRVDLRSVMGIIAEANLPLLFLGTALYFFAIVLGAMKWRILVKAQDIDASLGALLSFSLMGLFFGNVLPSNIGGDVVRAYDLARVTKGRAEAAAISVLVDRLMGMCAFFSAAVVTAALATVMLAQAHTLEQIEVATVIAASAFLALCAALFSRRIARRVAVLFEIGPAKRVKPMAQNIYRALQVYRFRYGALALNVLLSMTIVVVTALVWFLVGRAVGITHVSFFAFLLFNPLIAFVLLIPISFNGLGPKEAAVVFFFGLVAVPEERALAMSLLFHVIVVVTSLPGGFVWFSKRRHAAAREYQTSEMLHTAPAAPTDSSQ